ncbi:cytochrome b/b6 domain-containing protein [Caulobacter sp. LARHSG274]
MARAAVAIWDLPIRIFHWALVILVGLAWWFQETGNLNLHRIAGSSVVGLLVFRFWWGVFGGTTARFSTFVKGPKAVAAYARSLFSATGSSPGTGHNPLGGWSVIALLACLAAILAGGLFAVDVDGLEAGPLSVWVSFESARLASKIHGLAFQGLEALVVIHLLAIAFYAVFKRRNLVGPMVTGGQVERAATRGAAWALAVGIALGLAATSVLLHLSGTF